ncbi:Dip2/Utp12 family-domain-containing protein [Chaetomium sp. MPI-CAGE-AT-0009]|nr:Dip2/Utp12 family-domain-containing protein [Chaetomium sp. MPI-CAGE-AT-0009]
MSTKRKAAATLAKPVVRQSAKTPVRTKIDETRTAVSSGLSSKLAPKAATDAEIETPSSDDDQEGLSEDEADEAPNSTEIAKTKRAQDEADTDAVMQDGVDNSDGEPASPTFGDLVRGNSTIDVPASLAAQAAATQTSRQAIQQRPTAPLNATSLGTVLTQALRTDDADLLESCLQTTDVKIIENTINRLDSSLANTLLSKLSARMHRRPGRAFGLMRWMQWTLVAHGGALATQPDLVARLGELSRVLEERSRGLSSLLALKGKLDMLDAQMKFRKSVKATGAARIRGGNEEEFSEEEEEDVDEPGVVYVEGQETLGKALTNGATGRAAGDEDDDFPAGATVISDSEEEDDEEFDEGMDEELADAESLDEDEVDHDDVEEDEEEEESDHESSRPPSKVRRVSERISKRK